MLKKLLLAGIAVVAVGGPVAVFSAADWWKSFRQSLAGSQTKDGSADDQRVAAAIPATSEQSSKPAIEGAPVADLAEVFRFDVTPSWVTQRWPRVSTGLANLQLEGYRVALVSGTRPTDLAGALTYYFNSAHQVQQITFRGTTGDTRSLVRMLTSRYRLARRITNDPGTVIYEAVNPVGKTTSMARIHQAAVVKADDPNRRYVVELVLERPKT
jgi:hypothetical protein